MRDLSKGYSPFDPTYIPDFDNYKQDHTPERITKYPELEVGQVKLIDGYWVDRNNNSWKADKYTTKEIAEGKSLKLHSCYNCIDCDACFNCNDCRVCIGCMFCESCNELEFSVQCYDCHNSEFLHHCIDCTSCNTVGYCRNVHMMSYVQYLAAKHGYDELNRPKEVFMNEFMTFGDAIEALKKGNKVARKGWNGKGMYLWLKPAVTVKSEWCKDPILKDIVDNNGGEIEALGTICMYTHDSTGRKAVLTGWLASQSDMLLEDWMIVS